MDKHLCKLQTLATKWQYAAITSWSIQQNVELGITKYYILYTIYKVLSTVHSMDVHMHIPDLQNIYLDINHLTFFRKSVHLGASLRFLDFEFFLRKKKVDPIAQRNDYPGYLFVWLDVVSIMYIRVWYLINAKVFVSKYRLHQRAFSCELYPCICMLNSPSFWWICNDTDNAEIPRWLRDVKSASPKTATFTNSVAFCEIIRRQPRKYIKPLSIKQRHLASMRIL